MPLESESAPKKKPKEAALIRYLVPTPFGCFQDPVLVFHPLTLSDLHFFKAPVDQRNIWSLCESSLIVYSSRAFSVDSRRG